MRRMGEATQGRRAAGASGSTAGVFGCMGFPDSILPRGWGMGSQAAGEWSLAAPMKSSRAERPVENTSVRGTHVRPTRCRCCSRRSALVLPRSCRVLAAWWWPQLRVSPFGTMSGLVDHRQYMIEIFSTRPEHISDLGLDTLCAGPVCARPGN